MLWLGGCWRSHTGEPPREATGGQPADGRDASGGMLADPLPDPPLPDPCIEFLHTPRPVAAAVDVVWVVDSSRSMMDERARITDTINRFVEDIQSQVSDVHVVMITDVNIVPAPLGTDPDRYRFVPRYVDSQEPLQALLEHLPEYRDFLRPNAQSHLIVVSDDDSALSAAEFLPEMDRELGPFTFHAVASPDIDGQACRDAVPNEQCLSFGDMYPALCGGAAPGIQYYELAAVTGGERISICDDDWAMVFGLLSNAVLEPAPVPCTLPLAVRSDGEAPSSVEVRLLPEEVPLDRPVEFASADACAEGVAGFYQIDGPLPQVGLCPVSCEHVREASAEVLIRLDCDPR